MVDENTAQLAQGYDDERARARSADRGIEKEGAIIQSAIITPLCSLRLSVSTCFALSWQIFAKEKVEIAAGTTVSRQSAGTSLVGRQDRHCTTGRRRNGCRSAEDDHTTTD